MDMLVYQRLDLKVGILGVLASHHICVLFCAVYVCMFPEGAVRQSSEHTYVHSAHMYGIKRCTDSGR